jgi:hypothetical protein
MNKQNSAVITATLAAGSVASPYYFQVNIAQRLCSPACEAQVPVFNPQFSLVGYSAVGTGQYVATIHVEGLISYVPCGGNSCCTRTQLISQNFTIPFASATAPTSVTIEAGTTVNAIQVVACQSCSRDFVSAIPITLTVA